MCKTERIHFTKEQRQEILKKTSCKCGHCGIGLDVDTMTVEHIYPIHKGGTNEEYNLVALCKKCNNEKSNFAYYISDFYPYINKEEFYKFEAYNVFLASKNNSALLEYSRFTYKLMPEANKIILHNMTKRKASPKKIQQMIPNLLTSFTLEKAYPGDAEDIMNLINKVKKNTRFNTDLYTNEYQIINDIKCGEAYVLRSKKAIHGAFLFKKLNDKFNIDIPQLNNMEDCSILRKRYIMTLAILERQVGELLPDIMSDIQNRFFISKAIPIYFNILGNCYREDEPIISMPYELDGVHGELEFMPISHIRNVCVDGYLEDARRLGIEEITREDVEFYVEHELLYGTVGFTEEDFERLDEIIYLLSGKKEFYKELRRLLREDRLKK